MADITKTDEKYKDRAIRFIDKTTHYELIFTDDFVTPSSGSFDDSSKSYTLITDVVTDMRNANKDKELHIFIGSYGGQVSALNMIYQQVLTFKYRVAINLGMADSCGWMLYFVCHERYTSPFSQFMFHSMSSFSFGKVQENKNHNHFDEKWWKILLSNTCTEKVLTKDELKLGETSEVWLVGQDIIDRGFAKDYNEYLSRKSLVKNDNVFTVDDKIYVKEDDKYIKYQKSNKSESFTYEELIKKINK